MKIGNIELPDICPECGTKLLKKPGPIIGNFYPVWETYSAQCLKCRWESDRIKIKIDYKKRHLDNMKDATPYKKYLWGLFKKRKRENDDEVPR